MRLCSHPQEPCPKLRKWVGGGREWPRENCKGGARPVFSIPHLQLESLCQGQPWRSPCNKPLCLPSSKDSFPKLTDCLPACPPARPPAMELPECPQLSLPLNLSLGPSSCWLWEAGVHSPSVVAGVIPTPKMGKGLATLGQLVSCTEEKYCTGGTARSVGRWEPETIS